MPEGPEIRRAADAIERALIADPVNEIFFAFAHLKPYEEQLKGDRVTHIETHGKAMLIRFASHLNIYTHNQLYGTWVIRPAHDYPETKRQLRLAIHNERSSALLYSASEIQVLTDEEIPYHPFLRRLGPDVLDSATTVQQVVDRLKNKQFYRKSLAGLLLDQGFLCGLGNYLRSEVLFVARVHPTLKPANCSDAQITALAEGAIALTRQSYKTGGITNNLELVARLKQEGWKRSDYRHWVFNREGNPCFVCGTAIMKEIVAGRRCYYCPGCQGY